MTQLSAYRSNELPPNTSVQCRFVPAFTRQSCKTYFDLTLGLVISQEDEKIASLVGKLGAKRWSLIAQELPGRIGKQCRERYSSKAAVCTTFDAHAYLALLHLALSCCGKSYGVRKNCHNSKNSFTTSPWQYYCGLHVQGILLQSA